MKHEMVKEILAEAKIYYTENGVKYVENLANSLEQLYTLCEENSQLELLETIMMVDDFEDFITIYKLYEKIKGDK